jgi:SAM-dependent methyltransferase
MPRSMLAVVREVGDQAIHERLAEVLAPVRSQLLARLTPREDERLLDLNTFEGNAEYLPYDDGDFEVVVSTFAFIWAPDHANVASELARVIPSGGRLGFTAWKPNPKLGELYRRFSEEPLEGRESTEWGREDHVEDMLGEDFELDFEDGTLWLDVESGEDLWQLFSLSSPPLVSMLRRLDSERSEQFHRAFVELFESYREGERVRAPRRYLLTLGRRR